MTHVSPVLPAFFPHWEPSLLKDELLSDLFAGSARQFGARPALEFAGQIVSYEELERRANRFASALRERGIGRGSFVGLWMQRSADLHVALLGILKSGAAYLPFDADAPIDRVADCMADCQAVGIVVDAVNGAKQGDLPAARLDFATVLAGTGNGAAPDLRAEGMGPQDPAYVIYTSGSTGKPKGVVISHRNICHFLRSANLVYGLNERDVMFQGASVAFDLSLEEIFLPYMTGAKLWVASRQTMQDTENLAGILSAAGVTVIDTVPTLLSMLPADVPSLRIIILGGEACPPALAERWCRPGRRLFNSYGPTESTVVATVAEVTPGQPVTIGRPIPNYTCYIVDEALRPVPPGVQGELLIGGPSVAAGYLNRPDLTAQKFIDNPFASGRNDPFLYRSGDAVSLDENGNIAFHGRIDDQVKIRGYRVELGEIEARLAQLPGISHAAVVVRQDGGTDRLVAFLTGKDIGDRAYFREALKADLPCYMIPSHYEAVEELPRLASGKVNRKALQNLPLSAVEAEEQEDPATETEALLLAAARTVFPGQSLPFDADVFTDLGGHSLIAARFVSAVRQTPALAGLTLQDVYNVRTLRAMAALLDQRGIGVERDLSFTPPPFLRRLLCGLAQAAVLPLILALTTAPWLGVFVAYQLFSGEEQNFFDEVVALLVTYGVINISTFFVAATGKWIAIGRTRPGRYPLWGVYYFRWWLSQRFISMVHVKWLQGTPLIRVYLRILGAKIGNDVILGDFEAGAVDLISIGDGASLGAKLLLSNAEVVGNELIIGRIDIGADVIMGSSCVVCADTVLGEGTQMGDLTSLPVGTRTGAWERWDGTPGRKIGSVDPASLPEAAQAGALRRAAQGLLYLGMLLILPPVSLIPILPAFYFIDTFGDQLAEQWGIDPLLMLPMTAWPAAIALIAFTVLLIALVRWTVLPRVRAGHYSVHSWFYLRKWFVALATELTLETLSSLYATVYMRAWYRLMGAKIGKDSEISTNLAGRYDLTEIGEKCFIADEVVLGDEEIHRGWMILEPVKTGSRVFVGNDAVVPPGSSIPDGALIGIKSRPPSDGTAMAESDIWFGSPPLKLPVRQRFDDVAANWTYTPPRWRRLARALFEAFSVSLPTMLFIVFGTLAVDFLAPSILARDYWGVIPRFMACSVVISCSLVLAAIAVKWLTMGTYRPTVKPMWSWWALRTEAVAVMYWGMAGKVLLDHLRGTPMLPWVLRLFGSKFGKGVFMDTTDITEFDCIDVGDFCVINSLSALQTHLYEDRVMKVGRVVLGTGVSVGAGSTVLYDTHCGDFSRVGPLTIIMKGEEIPASSEWQGAPAVSVA
ncbi:MAG TPA: Pls/PosA family non-ribosomal peptide synthetase [Candidatus Sulfotelmatobacter sp.]|jgi:non-ribosomal peptide synthetase-like protein|nr:Pls/PosA family non-ribosomal peptide synthetase [Candidatus Sulfotelmatobacter sp.]